MSTFLPCIEFTDKRSKFQNFAPLSKFFHQTPKIHQNSPSKPHFLTICPPIISSINLTFKAHITIISRSYSTSKIPLKIKIQATSHARQSNLISRAAFKFNFNQIFPHTLKASLRESMIKLSGRGRKANVCA